MLIGGPEHFAPDFGLGIEFLRQVAEDLGHGRADIIKAIFGNQEAKDAVLGIFGQQPEAPFALAQGALLALQLGHVKGVLQHARQAVEVAGALDDVIGGAQLERLEGHFFIALPGDQHHREARLALLGKLLDQFQGIQPAQGVIEEQYIVCPGGLGVLQNRHDFALCAKHIQLDVGGGALQVAAGEGNIMGVRFGIQYAQAPGCGPAARSQSGGRRFRGCWAVPVNNFYA